MDKAGAREGGEWAGKVGIGPWHLSPYATPHPP